MSCCRAAESWDAVQIPGRMSDSAVAGAGAYAETGIGGCGSTGDGDIHLRFLPCYQVFIPPELYSACYTPSLSHLQKSGNPLDPLPRRSESLLGLSEEQWRCRW